MKKNKILFPKKVALLLGAAGSHFCLAVQWAAQEQR